MQFAKQAYQAVVAVPFYACFHVLAKPLSQQQWQVSRFGMVGYSGVVGCLGVVGRFGGVGRFGVVGWIELGRLCV